MKQWLTCELAVPRWVVLSILILTTVSFTVSYARVHELHKKNDSVEFALEEFRRTLESHGIEDYARVMDPGGRLLELPPWVTITDFVEMQIGLLSSLSVVIGIFWVLVRGKGK